MNIAIRTWLVLSSLPLLLAGCDQPPGETLWQTDGKTMGTTYAVQIARCSTHICNEQLAADIRTRLGRLDAQYSQYRKDSELSRFNRHFSSDWFAASHEFVEIVTLANEISTASNGAFDITLGEAVDAWGFGPETRQIPPAADDVSRALSHSGYKKLETRFTPAALRKQDPNLKLDMSAIVKGYAADQLAAMLEYARMTDYVIDIGGELRVSGKRSDGKLWQIGIASPAENEPIEYVLTPKNNAVATSGDYRNFYFSKGQRVSHTIDPASAKPVNHSLSSVTVIDPLGASADAWATALMVMGPETGLAFAEARGIPALFLARVDGELAPRMTAAMRAYIRTN